MPPKNISHSEAMHLNRKDRRKIGKANKIKIFGSNQAHVPESQRKHALTTFTGKKI
jgi:hypothetical protein